MQAAGGERGGGSVLAAALHQRRLIAKVDDVSLDGIGENDDDEDNVENDHGIQVGRCSCSACIVSLYIVYI